MPSNTRSQSNRVHALIMDLAGTCVDFGSMAPIRAFRTLFAEAGIPISVEEARAPMGSEKRQHIAALLAMPRIADAWLGQHGRPAADADLDALYERLIPIQRAAIAERTTGITGLNGVIQYCSTHGIGIGVNTGYGRSMIDVLLQRLADQGFHPASVVAATDVTHPRPAPDMSLLGAMQLRAPCVQACVKVDDTAVGIEEGLNAGMWTVGVSVSGNGVGMDQPDWAALHEDEQARKREAAAGPLIAAGAHAVIDSIADLPAVLDQIGFRLRRGERP